MHPKHTGFSVEVPLDDQEAMKRFDDAMAEMQDEHWKYVENTAKELGVSDGAASDICYLRTRSRWTQEKEDYLVRLAKAGQPLPNIFEDFEVQPFAVK
jgi:hypothetical protein